MGIAEEYVKKFKTQTIVATITRVGIGQKPSVYATGTNYYSPADFDVINCSLNFGFDQSSATCTLVIESDIEFKPMDRVVIDQGWNGSTRRTFFGFIDSISHADFPRLMTLECRDILKLAMNNYYIDYNKLCYYYTTTEEVKDHNGNPMGGQSESERYAEEIIKDLLIASGIPDTSEFQDLDIVDIDGYRIVVGNHKYWVIVNMSAMDAINQLCDLVGYRIWATPDGTVKLKMGRGRIASSTYNLSYSREVDIFYPPESFVESLFGSIISITADSSDENLRNWVDVIGYEEDNIHAHASYPSDYVPDPPTYKRCEITSELIDVQSVAEAIANKVLSDLNRITYSAQVSIIGDPRLQIGQTIGIYDPYAVSPTVMNYFLDDYSSTFSARGYTIDLGLTGGVGTGSVPISGNKPPVAIWYPTITSGEIICKAENSYDPDGLDSGLTYVWYCAGYSTKSGLGDSYNWNSYDVVGSGTLVVSLHLTDSGSPKLTSILARSIVYSGMV